MPKINNRYAVFQVKQDHKYDSLRGVPYKELREKHLRVSIENYDQVYMAPLRKGNSVYTVFHRLCFRLPDGFKGHEIQSSDVIVLKLNQNISSFYVDGHSLVLLPMFTRPEGDSKMVQLDAEDYVINGKSGTWTVAEEIIVKGMPFYIMKNERDPKANYVLLSIEGEIIMDDIGTNHLSEEDKLRLEEYLENNQTLYFNRDYLQALQNGMDEELLDMDSQQAVTIGMATRLRTENRTAHLKEQQTKEEKEKAEQTKLDTIKKENYEKEQEKLKQKEEGKKEHEQEKTEYEMDTSVPEMEKWQRYYENGMYEKIDPSVDVGEANYDFIDGRNGNNPDVTKFVSQEVLSGAEIKERNKRSDPLEQTTEQPAPDITTENVVDVEVREEFEELVHDPLEDRPSAMEELTRHQKIVAEMNGEETMSPLIPEEYNLSNDENERERKK